jgi:hypothetical protein
MFLTTITCEAPTTNSIFSMFLTTTISLWSEDMALLHVQESISRQIVQRATAVQIKCRSVDSSGLQVYFLATVYIAWIKQACK